MDAMDLDFDDIDQLAELLAAEAEGLPLDRQLAGRLAERLGASCPDIRRTMETIRQRMTS